MVNLKDLYLASSLDDLQKMTIVPNLKNKKAAQLTKSADTVLKEATKQLNNGDEELAYVYLMKYFSILTFIKTTPDYSSQKKYIMLMLGTNDKCSGHFELLERLQTSLLERYKKRAEGKLLKSIDSAKRNLDFDIENETEEISEINQSSTITITCKDLYEFISNPFASLLVMDCRTMKDFEASKLNFTNLVNIPEEIIRQGLSAGKISEQLTVEARKLWAARMVVERVILIDWCSSENDPVRENVIWQLRNILLMWDPDVQYPNSVQIVEGGYENFTIMYPMITTNPNYKREMKTDMSRNLLNDIEYPLLTDIKMKDDTISEGSPFKNDMRPGVDRRTKLAAMQHYSDMKPIDSIFREKEELTERALEKEKEALKVQRDLREIMQKEQEIKGEEEKKKWYDEQQELSYKLMRYENERDDNITHRNELEQELQARDLSEQEKLEMTIREQSIQEKETERLRVEEERKRITEDYGKRLQNVREQKRHSQLNEEMEPPKHKLPAFDRTKKPNNSNPLSFSNSIQRNFTADYETVPPGLAGLRNLGNTCYMNSIIQCLINVEPLCEYLRNEQYQKHLNQKCRTRGEIVTEFAAVAQQVWSGNVKSIAPRDLRYTIGQYEKMFSGYEQQDAHEFLTILMDLLHSELQITRKEDIPKQKLSASEKAWLEFINNKHSIIQNLFHGQIQSLIKCKVCEQESATYEAFSNLSLELPQNSRECSIEDCLKMYFHGEIINGWNCPKCKDKRDAIKKLNISKKPPILVIHFKRFCADLESSTYKKKQNFVTFPLKEFDISDYLTRSARIHVNTYNLTAVSNHYGSMEIGHYTAYCKNYKNKHWYRYDDHTVTQIENKNVVSSAAYILFYSNF